MKKHFLFITILLFIIAGRASGQACTLVAGPADQTVCEGSAITDIQYTLPGATTLTDISLPAGLTHNFTAPTLTISGTPTASGTYSLTLSDGSATCSSSGTITRSLNPSAIAGGSTTICDSETATVTGASASNGSILWTHSGAGSLTNATTASPTYDPDPSDAGSTVILTMTVSNSPCADAIDTYTVTVVASPTASAGGSTAICEDGTATVSGASASGTILWTVTSGGGTLTGETTLTPTYDPVHSDAGTTVVLTMSVSNGTCTATPVTYSITVNPQPTLGTVDIVDPVCEGTKGGIMLTGLLQNSSLTVNYSFPGHAGQTANITTGPGVTQQTFLTNVNLDYGDNGHTLTINSITATSSTPTCSQAVFTDSTATLAVDKYPTLSNMDLVTPQCEGATTTISLSGLIPGSWSTIEYTLSGSTYNRINVHADDISGDASFPSIVLQTENNGDDLEITRVTRETGAGCSSATSESHSITVNALPSAAFNGDVVVCAGSVNKEYSAGGSMTSYSWSITGGTITTSNTQRTIKVDWGAGPGGTLAVTVVKNGCSATTTPAQPITINPSVSPTITGSSLVYPGIPVTYSTTTGMLSYDWSIVGGTPLTGDGSSIQVTWNSNPTHTVSLSYKSLAGCQSSLANLNVSVRPSVTGVHIDYLDGDPKIGGRFAADYTYVDGSTGTDASTYVWKRGVTIVSTAKVYTAVAADFNQVLSCEVTPVSSIGALTGTPVTVLSLPVEDLTHAGVVPVAYEVCIDGTRSVGSTLRGMYRYDYPYKDEGVSTFRWLKRDTLPAGSETEIGTGIEYTLTNADIADNKEIYFEVTPVSSNYHPIAGVAQKSKPLAKIMGLEQQYVVTAPPVTMKSNVPGGYFSGPGVYGNTFIPDSSGTGTFELNYFKFYEYSGHACAQRSPQSVIVDESLYTFDPMIQSRYCSYDAAFTTAISPVPGGVVATNLYCLNKDGINDMSGITRPDTYTININPGLMSPGKHTLVFEFRQELILPFPLHSIILHYRVRKDFVIERVRRDIKFIGLTDKYCKNSVDQYIAVEGVNPLEGTGTWEWTGLPGDDLLIDEVVNSAIFRPGKGSVGEAYHIRYLYQAPLGCESNQLDEEVTIYNLPDAGFSIESTYNVEGPPDLLEPDVDPGTGTYSFTGKGVSRDYFIPSLAAEGEILPASIGVTYTITDVNSCTNSSTEHTWVRQAIGTISGITPIICYTNIDIPINASGVPVNGVDGIVTYLGFRNLKNTLTPVLGATSALYSVPDAGKGADRIDFKYRWDGVDYIISKEILIDSLGKVEIYNLEQDQIICKDAAPFALEVSKPGGFFSGPVDPGGNLLPASGTAPDVVTYTYVNPDTKCSIDTVYNINVYDAPNVDFIPYDVCIIDDTDTLRFINNTTSADPVVAWEWKFYDEGVITPSSVRDAKYLYLRGGLQKISLRATTDKGCFVEREKTFDIARRPEADFYWKKDCFHPDELLQLYDATSFTTPPKTWSWKINGAPSGSSNTTTYLKTDTGFLHVEYIVRTDYADCHDTVTKDVYIRPSITLGADGYFEDFERGKGGWIIGDTSTIWSFGTPSGNKIQEAASGQKVWFTANARDGSSAIESPCFDFAGMTRPLVKMKLQRDLDKDRDGAVLQYKVGDEPAWKLLGTIDDGIDWYNSAVISGRPGGSPVGWTTAGSSDEQYYDAIHTLDELKGKKDVKFRMIYGAAGVFSEHDGLAFDNVFIGERSRQVLVEHFMSYSNTESMIYKALIDTVAEHREGDVINIQYHTNLSGIDSLYMFNPGEINARILFYGLTRVPYTFVDGGTGSEIDKTFNMLYDYKSNPVDSNEITKRTLVSAPFKLHIDPVISGRVLSVKGYIKALENISAGNLTLFIAITEKKAQVDFSGAPSGMKFLNVFRKFIPDASGTILRSNWSAGDSTAIPEKAWTIDRALNASDIEIIAFLQSAGSKDVYQAFSVVKPDILVGVENPFGREGKFSIYPNPASEFFTISFDGTLRNAATVRIYNFSGEIVREYKAGAGINEYTIEDPGLKGGIYLVRISSGIFDMGFKKLIITED